MTELDRFLIYAGIGVTVGTLLAMARYLREIARLLRSREREASR